VLALIVILLGYSEENDYIYCDGSMKGRAAPVALKGAAFSGAKNFQLRTVRKFMLPSFINSASSVMQQMYSIQ
jgi:hypothetical protein